MKAGTHVNLSFGANHAVLHAQKDRCGLGPIETCNSVPKALFGMRKTQTRTETHRHL